MTQLEARVDLLERMCAELLDENRRLRRDVDAAVDQAKHAIRKLDQMRAALDDVKSISPNREARQ